MSWASIAKTQPKPSADSSSVALTAKQGLKLLVVDANAIIDGAKLEGIADRAVTIQEVLDEIRDKQSRQYLANLPYQLEVSEPTEESIQAVTRFARATGDVAALSTVDMRLLALARTLEVSAHGSDHLASHPNQPRMHTKASFAEQELPGWGSVPNPEDWKAVDEANDADEAALLAASTSRIAQHVQQLTLDPSAPNSFLQEPSSAAGAAGAGAGMGASTPAAPLTPEAVGEAPRAAAGSPLGAPAAAAAAAAAAAVGAGAAQQQQAAAANPPAAAAAAAAAAADGDAEGGDAEGDVWEVAASSKGAARHRKRKAVKRQQHQQAFEQEWAEHSQLVQQQQQQSEPQLQVDAQQQKQEQQREVEAAAAQSEDAQDVAADGSKAAADATNEELLAEEHQVYTADDGDTSAQQQADGSSNQQQQRRPGSPGWQSSVAIITGDFAMQNVLLQMGLRLITQDGRRIARLTRYALRCSACFTVTRDPGRLFCPKCGNLSLDRVEVVVGADGAEYFGVTKRHILRGTRFSLPKPKGGRTADDLVLREDVFLQKVKALGKQAVKKKAADEDAAADVDPFAPKYNQDTWHVPSQQELAAHRGLAAVLQPAWKQNPNERKLTRSNRRG